jgi:hypothetical protein
MLGLSALLHATGWPTHAPASRGPQVAQQRTTALQGPGSCVHAGRGDGIRAASREFNSPSFSACGPLPKMSCSSVRGQGEFDRPSVEVEMV